MAVLFFYGKGGAESVCVSRGVGVGGGGRTQGMI